MNKQGAKHLFRTLLVLQILMYAQMHIFEG